MSILLILFLNQSDINSFLLVVTLEYETNLASDD